MQKLRIQQIGNRQVFGRAPVVLAVAVLALQSNIGEVEYFRLVDCSLRPICHVATTTASY